MPHKPMVPAGAPAELRLDAKKETSFRSIRTEAAMWEIAGLGCHGTIKF